MADTTQGTAPDDAREEMHEVRERYGWPEIDSGGIPTVFVPRGQLLDVVRKLHADGYLVCTDVTAVDYLTFGRRTSAEGDVRDAPRVIPGDEPPERFEAVYHFACHRDRTRVRLRVQVPESDPTLPSLWEIHPGAEAAEREVFDMFGIGFSGHPDLTRILMPEDWIGYPLRKDYNSGRIPVQFKDTPAAR